MKEEDEAAGTDAEDTPCGEESRSPTPTYSSESIPSSVEDEEEVTVEGELESPIIESPINEGLLADITLARDTVIKMKLVNQKIHRSLKLASTHVRERRS